MKCTGCHAAEPVIKYRDEVPYWYKGHMTSIHGVKQMVCLRCGAESIPPGHAQQWLEQTATFRAEIDAQKLGQGKRPDSLKDWIMVEWLDLDPDLLAAGVPVEMIRRPRPQRDVDGVVIEEFPYVSWQAVSAYNERAYEAFAGYKGSHTTDLAGYAYAEDWEEFLDALRQARAIAADPQWEAPRDGVVYRNLA